MGCGEQLRPVLKHIEMKSRITIEVDYENGRLPVIQILSRGSDDVRDNLIKDFYQILGSSSWCKIEFKQDVVDHDDYNNGFKRIYISPIPQNQLKKEAVIMMEQDRVYKEWEKSAT